MEKRTPDFLHAEHLDWLSKLDFYQDEIKIMQGRLDEAAHKLKGREEAKKIEQLQNKLILQQEQMDILRHEIHEHESYLEAHLLRRNKRHDGNEMNDHSVHRERMEAFEVLFSELHSASNRFFRIYLF